MVLQQNCSMRIWGKAEPKEKLKIKFNEQTVAAVADAKGNWAVNIETGAAGGPYQLEVASETNDTKVVFSNVLVGEVWVCGGQGNMSVPVSETESAQADIAGAKNFPQVRLFQVDQLASNEELADFAKVDPWFCCSSDTIKDFSAIGYFYARELSAKMDVPIGLIQLAGGPIALESWIPTSILKAEEFTELLEHWSNQNAPSNPQAASSLFNGMVSPLAQTPIAGVIWSHGTANIGRGEQYSRLFPLFIKSWRAHFRSNELPFYFVQPAPYRFEDLATDALPEIWDAQLKTFKSSSKLGMVVTTDLADSQLVHNKHKLTIAKRLSDWAFSGCYFAAVNKTKPPSTDQKPNQDDKAETQKAETQNDPDGSDVAEAVGETSEITDSGNDSSADNSALSKNACSGPIYESAKTEGNTIIVEFRYAQGGLKIDSDLENCFSICGADKKFMPAKARVDGSKLVVSHPDIEKPVAVRYAWKDTAQPVLTNSTGLPAAPFRTDAFTLTSSGIEF